MRTTKTRKPAAKKNPVKRGAAKKPTQRKRAKLWSAAEMAMLRSSYKAMTTPQIARKLKRTVDAVRTKVRAMGLRKAPTRKAAGPKFGAGRTTKGRSVRFTSPKKAARKSPTRKGDKPSRW